MLKRSAVIFMVLALLLPAAALGEYNIYAKGDAVADFTLELTDGSEFTLSDWRGSIVVVDMWATWCPNCVYYSMPAWEQLANDYSDEIKVVAVNCGDLAEDVCQFAEESGYECDIAIDENLEIMFNYFPTNAIPYTVFIDADGKYYTSMLGAGDGVADTYRQIIDEMLAD